MTICELVFDTQEDAEMVFESWPGDVSYKRHIVVSAMEGSGAEWKIQFPVAMSPAREVVDEETGKVLFRIRPGEL